MQRQIPVHLIPNCCIFKGGHRSQVRVLFPDLYEPGREPKLEKEHLQWIYDDAVRPTVAQVLPDRISHWPLTYERAIQLQKDNRGRFHLHTIDIPEDVLPVFAEYFTARFTAQCLVGRMIFHVEYRGTKNGYLFDWDSDDDRKAARDQLLEGIDFAEQESQNIQNWYIDVGLELSLPGHVLQWRTEGHENVIVAAHTSMSEARAANVIASSAYSQDLSAHLFELSGFRLAPRSPVDHVVYAAAYTTDKEATYQLHTGMFRAHGAEDLLPRKIDALIRDIGGIANTFYECSGSGGVAQDGTARLEVRVPLQEALRCMGGVPRESLRMVVSAFPDGVWW